MVKGFASARSQIRIQKNSPKPKSNSLIQILRSEFKVIQNFCFRQPISVSRITYWTSGRIAWGRFNSNQAVIVDTQQPETETERIRNTVILELVPSSSPDRVYLLRLPGWVGGKKENSSKRTIIKLASLLFYQRLCVDLLRLRWKWPQRVAVEKEP